MKRQVTFLPSEEHVNEDVQSNPDHCIKISLDAQGNNLYIESCTREALYELGRTLMSAALYGHGEIELYPLIVEGKTLVVEGVRLTEDSARMFVRFPKAAPNEL